MKAKAGQGGYRVGGQERGFPGILDSQGPYGSYQKDLADGLSRSYNDRDDFRRHWWFDWRGEKNERLSQCRNGYRLVCNDDWHSQARKGGLRLQ